MGQQQLLLIILGVIIVGIALAVGITLFTDSAQSSNRDAVSSELIQLAARAQQHYRRPALLGGGQGAFDDSKGGTGLTDIRQLSTRPSNANGSYELGTVDPNQMEIDGTGTEIGLDGTNKVFVKILVWADSTKIDQSTLN